MAFGGEEFVSAVGAMLRLAVAPHSGGTGFHYLLRDICLCLLQWNAAHLPGVCVCVWTGPRG